MANQEMIKYYIKKHKWSYIIGMIILLCVDYFQMYIPQIVGEVTDGIRDGQMTRAGIDTMIVKLIILVGILALGRIGWRYFIIGSSRKVEKNLRQRLFEKWVTLDQAYYNRHKTGQLMAHATNDLNAIRMMMGMGVIVVFDAAVMTLMVIIRMATYVDFKLTALAIIPMPFIAISSYYFGKRVKKRFGDRQEAFGKLSDKVQEAFTGIKVIKSFVQEYYDFKDFEQIAQDNYHKNLHLAKLSAIINPMMTLLVSLSLLIAIGYGGYLTMINRISVGQFVAFNQYILMLTWPMMAIAMGINVFAQGLASVKRIEDVLKEEADVKDDEEVSALEDFKGAIQIKNLSFYFSKRQEVGLKGVDLTIKQGETLAVLGRTGSGKSTLAQLLLRIYNAPKNTIFLDGKDIMTLSIKSVRQHIAYVPQDNFLFSDTVARNIGFGKDNLDQAVIEEAAKKAQVHENIIGFPKGYDTVVGERGTTLSGGQKQRVSIARALILDAPVLILDDALSAVDTKTEESILEQLKTIRKGKTTILIAHRISTVRHADQIVVIDDGRIIENGTHETLLKKQGAYADMVSQQQLQEAISEA